MLPKAEHAGDIESRARGLPRHRRAGAGGKRRAACSPPKRWPPRRGVQRLVFGTHRLRARPRPGGRPGEPDRPRPRGEPPRARVARRRHRRAGGRRHDRHRRRSPAARRSGACARATASAPSCASTRSRSHRSTPRWRRAPPSSPGPSACWPPSRITPAARRAARRPHGRQTRRLQRARRLAARAPDPLTSPPRKTTMAATIIDSRIFQGIFSSDAMRHVWSDENRTAEVPRHRARAGQGAGPAGPDPAGGRRRDRQPLPARPDRHGQAAPADRAHRLPDPGRRVAAQRSCAATSSASTATGARPRRTSPTPPPCCRSARRWRLVDARTGGDRRRDGQAGEGAPPDADDRPQQPAAGHSRDLRLQDGRAAVGDRSGTASAWRSCASACWSASSPAPPARWPRWRPARWKPRPGCAPNWA